MTEPSRYANPRLMCDIVMKGGITSGVVYPGAILSLAETYRFRSIGGTSAGAIAAAIASAAEHARRGGDCGGFRVIEDLPDQLGGTIDGGRTPFMLQLFQADKATRPLFRALTSFMGRHGKVRGTWRLVMALWLPVLVAAVVFAASVGLCAVGDADWAFGVAGIAASGLTLAIGAFAELLRGWRAIGDNDFGLCRLGPAVGSPDKPALTDWLHGRIQTAAGLTEADAPLTFADLWGVPATGERGPASADLDRLKRLRQRCHAPDERCVDLQMITTDLTQGRPLRLPILYDRHEAGLEDGADALLFDRLELRRFFPAGVVDHLVRHAEPIDDELRHVLGPLEREKLFAAERLERALRPDDWDAARSRPRLVRLPIGPDLPVVVAARMSLSFPILISTLPLWRLVESEGRTDIRRVVFSDGGITSNFPIHFFDSPLPRWPTFGLHLTKPKPGEAPDPGDARAWVEPPPAPGDPMPDRMREINDLADLGAAVADAARNWRDNSQARLPGFRDRIAHIKIDKTEGGLNLAMNDTAITRLNERGGLAGADLRDLFSTRDRCQPIRHWEDHRFARYRVTMAVMQRLMQSYHTGYTTVAPGDDVTTPYPTRLAQGQTTPPFEFGEPERYEAAKQTSAAYVAVAGEADSGLLDDENVPRPPATMRTVPPV